MTIYLVCDCGKKLKARMDCAGRRVMCPRCRRMWRLPGENGEQLEAEPLALEADDDASVAMEEPDEVQPRHTLGTWISGGVALVVFVALLTYLFSTFEGFAPARRTADDCGPSDGGSTSVRVSFPGRKPFVPPAEPEIEQAAEKAMDEGKRPPVERQAPTPPPVVDKTPPPPVIDKSPEPLPLLAEIASMEPAEPIAEGTVTIKLRGVVRDGVGLMYEYRLGQKEAWQPVVGQEIKLRGLKPGMVALEVRAVDPKGRETPILQRNIPVKPAPINLSRLKEGDVLWQEVVVTRASSYKLLGNDVTQNTQYGFLSKLTVEKKHANGTFTVQQKIEVAKLERVDPILQALIGDSLEKMQGVTFKITLSPTQEVVRFEGPPQPPQVFGGDAILGGALLVWSFLDPDAWKELAQHTFFLPDRPLKKDEKWSRKIAHSWGALGNWTGDVAYVATGKQANGQRINYTMDLRYQPPTAGAPSTGLPFKVGKAEFKPQAAAGALLFDPDKFRVTAAEEQFRVRGQLALTLLGTETVLEMDEAQSFQLRVHERNPLRR